MKRGKRREMGKNQQLIVKILEVDGNGNNGEAWHTRITMSWLRRSRGKC